MSKFLHPHKSRRAKVDYLCSIGGYGDRYNHWPIEFSVGCYYTDFDADFLRDRMMSGTGDSLESLPKLAECNLELLNLAFDRTYKECGEHLFDWGLEDARNSLTEDEYYTEEFGLKFELHGRQGKHLVLTEAGGVSLAGISARDLDETLMAQTSYSGYTETVSDRDTLRKGYEWEIPTAHIDSLYRAVRKAAVIFTPENASKCVQYNGEWQFFTRVADTYKEILEEVEDREAVKSAARGVLNALPVGNSVVDFHFAKLCLAAGVDTTTLED